MLDAAWVSQWKDARLELREITFMWNFILNLKSRHRVIGTSLYSTLLHTEPEEDGQVVKVNWIPLFVCWIPWGCCNIQFILPDQLRLGLCTEHNRGWILQSGRVIHVCFVAPMGHGLSLSCPAPRSGFVWGKKKIQTRLLTRLLTLL